MDFVPLGCASGSRISHRSPQIEGFVSSVLVHAEAVDEAPKGLKTQRESSWAHPGPEPGQAA